MDKRHHVAAAFLMMAAFCQNAEAETLRWDVQARYGATAKGIRTAVSAAKEHFAKAPDDVVILEFEEG